MFWFRWAPPWPRAGRSRSFWTEDCWRSRGTKRWTRPQSRAAPRLYRRLSGAGLRLHAAGGSDRQFSHAQQWWSVWRWRFCFYELEWYKVSKSVLSTFLDPEAARTASSKVTTTLGLVVHAAGKKNKRYCEWNLFSCIILIFSSSSFRLYLCLIYYVKSDQ